MPNVVGLKLDDAEKVLAKANFTPNVIMAPSVEPAGTVFAQSPAGGAHARLGSVVTIKVSNGKTPSVPVPNVVGMSRQQAVGILRGAGFAVEVVEEIVFDPKKDGIVLSQMPSGGKHRVGSTVVIHVGKFGPSPSPSPS